MHGFKPKANCQLAAIIMHNASKTNDLFKSSIKPNVQGVFDFSVTGWSFFDKIGEVEDSVKHLFSSFDKFW